MEIDAEGTAGKPDDKLHWRRRRTVWQEAPREFLKEGRNGTDRSVHYSPVFPLN
jgi:hypothetical protein